MAQNVLPCADAPLRNYTHFHVVTLDIATIYIIQARRCACLVAPVRVIDRV